MKLKQEDIKTFTYAAVAVGGLFFLYKFGKGILTALNLVDTEEEKAIEKNRQKALKSAQKEQQKKGVQQTRSDLYWQNAADSLYDAWKFSALDDDKDLAEAKLKEPMNDVDFLKLQEYYGARQNYFFGIPEGGLRNLTDAANSELSQERIDRINEIYRQRGIKYKI